MNRGPTQGEAVAGMVACLLQGICALYRMEPFAAEEPVLRTRFPHDDAKAWHDDHLGDTLDAIGAFGPGALQGAVTAPWLEGLGVRIDPIQYDTTSFKVFGRYRITSTATMRKRYQGRGRPGAGGAYAEIAEVHWSVEWQWLPAAIEKATGLGGYFPLLTHDPTLTTARALSI